MLKVQGEDGESLPGSCNSISTDATALAHRLDLLQTLNPIAKAEDKQDAPAQATKKRRENPFRSHQSQRGELRWLLRWFLLISRTGRTSCKTRTQSRSKARTGSS